jgi:EmrB/QacA subfamily drug resistance transporter
MTLSGYGGGNPRGEISRVGGVDLVSRSRVDGAVGVDGRAGQAPLSPPERRPPVPPVPPAPPVPPSPGSAGTTKWIVPLGVVVIGMFMSTLDTSIVNVAIPTMQNLFGVSTDSIQWVSTAYTLCLGVVVPASAWLGDRIGLRRLYVISMLMFSAFSALCGMAGGLNSMIFYRILQAIPGGVIPVTCLTILYKMVPREKIGVAMGLYGFGIIVAPGVGPTLGGYLVEYVDWRLIFYINVPVGIAGAILAMMILPNFPRVGGRSFDVPGFLCIAVSMFSLLLAFEEGTTWGWTGYRVLILIAVGVDALALFVVIELHVKEPLLNVRVFRYWTLVNSLIQISIISVGINAVLFYVPNFIQGAQSLTPMNSGLVLLPQAMVMMVVVPVAGRIYDRMGARWPAVIGLAVAAGGTFLMAKINIDMTRQELVVWMMIRAAGIGLAMMPIMTGGLSVLPANLASAGSAFNTLFQRVSASLGLALFSAMSTVQQAQFMADRSGLVQSQGPGTDPRLTALEQQGQAALIPLWQTLKNEVEAQAYSNIFLVLGVLTVAGMVFGFFLRSEKSTGDSGPVEIG